MSYCRKRSPFACCGFVTFGFLALAVYMMIYSCGVGLNHCSSSKHDMVVVSSKRESSQVYTDNGGYTCYYASFDLKYPNASSTYCELSTFCAAGKDDANSAISDHPADSLWSVYVYKHSCTEDDPRESTFSFGTVILAFAGIAFLVLVLMWVLSPHYDPLDPVARTAFPEVPDVSYRDKRICGILLWRELYGPGVIKGSTITVKTDRGIIWRVIGSTYVIMIVQVFSLGINVIEINSADSHIDHRYLLGVIIIQSAALFFSIARIVGYQWRTRVVTSVTLETMCVKGVVLNILKVAVNILSIIAAPRSYWWTISWNALCIVLSIGAQPILTMHVFMVLILWFPVFVTRGFVGGRRQVDLYEMYRTYCSWWGPEEVEPAHDLGAGADGDAAAVGDVEATAGADAAENENAEEGTPESAPADGEARLRTPLIPRAPAVLDRAVRAPAVHAPDSMRKAMLKTHVINCFWTEVKLWRDDPVIRSLLRTYVRTSRDANGRVTADLRPEAEEFII